MIRRLVIPIRADGMGENVLSHAALIAHRFHAHVEMLHCSPRPEDMLPFGIPLAGFLREQVLQSAARLASEEEAKLRGQFDAIVARLGLTPSPVPLAGRATAAWREVPGKQVDVIKTHGRLADLIVVSKPDRDRNLGANTLKSALFNTGRPVLMCPPREDPPEVLGEHVAIAWNGSTEAARAVAMTLGLIQAARAVSIFAGGTEVHGASPADLIDYLAARGVAAVLHGFEAKGRIGQRLLEAAEAFAADMMIMGAYSHSREHETVFGGTTQWVVDNVRLPVVLVR
ncbi:MAG TPA: universal stress protein [Paracoccaceae bacterium]|nr:universal stress protein [Paracoccaceae bacterium]